MSFRHGFFSFLCSFTQTVAVFPSTRPRHDRAQAPWLCRRAAIPPPPATRLPCVRASTALVHVPPATTPDAQLGHDSGSLAAPGRVPSGDDSRRPARPRLRLPQALCPPAAPPQAALPLHPLPWPRGRWRERRSTGMSAFRSFFWSELVLESEGIFLSGSRSIPPFLDQTTPRMSRSIPFSHIPPTKHTLSAAV